MHRERPGMELLGGTQNTHHTDTHTGAASESTARWVLI